MIVQEKSCCDIVADILHTKFNVPESALSQENWDKPLTGKIFNLRAEHLVYLFLEIEKQYSIRICGDHIDSCGFSTINKVGEVLGQYLYI